MNDAGHDFLWAVGELKAGRFVQRVGRGGRLIVKSRQQAYERMGVADWLASDWVPFPKVIE